MTELKIRARVNMQGNTFRMWVRYLTVRLLRCFALFLSVFPAMSIFYSPAGVAGKVFGEYSVYFAVASAITALVLFIASYFAEGYYEASVFFLADKNGPRPEGILSVRRAFGFIRLKAALFVLRTLFATLFFFPSLFLFYCAYSLLTNGNMIRSNFYVTAAVCCLLFITGALFYWFSSGRYYLSSYLFYCNPMTTAGNALYSSAALTRGKLIRLGISRLSLLPWRIFSVFGFTLPFSRVFCAFVRAGLCEKIYGERKCMPGESAVVFYVGKHSVITSGEKV